ELGLHRPACRSGLFIIRHVHHPAAISHGGSKTSTFLATSARAAAKFCFAAAHLLFQPQNLAREGGKDCPWT
ncbi:hypothetical protein NKI41_29365, partial [Mesorhizobium sp. M0601]|uniref:hypothetical protein n=1 Tax=unclassified Mesorhizobium TaxID=325217 RepID=UPI00333A4C83